MKDLHSIQNFQSGNLVIYHNNPARVIVVLDSKIEIETKGNKTVKVRNNDITFLHPGPINSLTEIETLPANIGEASDLLYGEPTTLKFITELLFSEFSPSGAWTIYSHLMDGIYFTGTIDNIQVRSRTEFEKDIEMRNAKKEEKKNWADFIEGLRAGKVLEENKKRLKELEDYAFGKTKNSLILKELNIQSTVENAHRLLLKLSTWNESVNPYPGRLGFITNPLYPDIKETSNEERLDLTHLTAYAIDDEGNKDPDDAISIDGNKLWVHIADVASIIASDSEGDIHARSYGATLYLPEHVTTMLSPNVTDMLGLGLKEISPALSFCLTLNENGTIDQVEIHLTKVKVKRITYSQADEMLGQAPLQEIYHLTQKYSSYRKSKNATFLSFPEVKIKVLDGKVSIKPIPMCKSRDMVAETMLMAGEAAAEYAVKNSIPFPFTTQPPPETILHPTNMADMFAYRKLLKPSLIKCSPDMHAGLGLEAYSRVTSPLRRYIDLVAHQQVRGYLKKSKIMGEQEVMMRIGAYNAVIGEVQKLERLSNLHWTLVYLLQNPKWSGEAIVVEHKERFSIVIIPELNMESRITISKDIPLNTSLKISVSSVDLPDLSAFFLVCK